MKKFLSIIMTIIITMSFMTISVDASTKVRLNKTSLSMRVGNTYTLKLNGAKGKVSWKSSSKSIATVSSKGKVTAKKVGKTTISAKYKNKTYKCKVSVIKTLANRISLSKKNLTLKKGSTYNLRCTISPSNTTNKKINWSSSNAYVATVNSQGKITTKKSGITTITATTTDGTKLKTGCVVKVLNTTVSYELKYNLSQLKNYILSYGEYNNAGYKAIYGEDSNYFYTISYLSDENCFNFYWYDDALEYNISESIQFKLGVTGFDYCNAELINVYDDGYDEGSYSADIIFDTANYNSSSTIPTIKIKRNTTDISGNTIVQYVNTSFKLAMSDWNLLLLKEIGWNLSDIGFYSYNN